MGRRNEYRLKGGDALRLGVKTDMVFFAGNTVCDPYLSTLEAFAWTRYTNRRLLYLQYRQLCTELKTYHLAEF